ncbi:hypothetical protein HYFRA_00003456 [Hymenoscyphus fraxineus]|uniref:Solute carrier family 40 member n=1 Tax=Hymenoscyphus fraxineus TaxID=746836 RepID=A0A9N9KUR7_9HELO|nr:hypothetical protein HYFRA_00003456 [Hymenoscyphus fraxineus]
MVDHEDFDQRTEEEGRLINDPSSPNLTQVHGMSRSQAINLYTRGIVRTVASICLSSIVGRWVDGSPNRMKTLSTTISFNRFAVISSCILWLGIAESANLNDEASSTSGFQFKLTPGLKNGMFSLILLLGVIETLSANGNMLSMERDFVPIAADPTHMKYNLTYLNSAMRRIDLTCKLLAPIMISVAISTTSVRIGILVVAAMSALSWGVELWCAKRVWNRNSRLRVIKVRHIGNSARVAREVGEEAQRTFTERISQIVRLYGNNFRNYFRSQVWIPSFSLALLHLSALSYGATFITFLLGSGFSLGLVTASRACGSIVEISSTFVTPVGVRYLGKAKRHDFIRVGESYNEEYDSELLESTSESSNTDLMTETGLQRLGLWGITSQLLCLIPVLYAIWLSSPSPSPSTFATRDLAPVISFPLQAFTIFAFLSLSRLGLWIFDLTTQQLTQTLNPPQALSTFTGVEYSFVSVFELCQHLMGIFLGRPEDFKWIASVSLIAVGISSIAYAGWVRHRRGHLVHWEKVSQCCKRTGLG